MRREALAWLTAAIAVANLAGGLVGVPRVRDETAGIAAAAPPDATTGTRLLVASCSGLQEVDVDARAIRPLTLPEAPDCEQHRTLVRRSGSVVVLGSETAFAVPFDPTQDTLALGKARSLFPAVSPDRIWLVGQTRDADGVGVAPVAREVRLDGRVTAGGVRMAYGRVPHAAVEGGFVTVGFRSGREVAIVAPDGSVQRTLADPGSLVDTSADKVAWVTGESTGPLRIADLGRNRTRTAATPPGVIGFGGAGAFSPNGVTLAVVAAAPDGHHLALVDVATGSASLIPGTGPAPPISSVVWSDDGTRIFAARPAVGTTYRLDTFLLGQPAAQAIPLPFLRGTGPPRIAVL